MIFDKPSIIKNLEIECSTPTTIKNISDKENVASITVPPVRPYNLINANFQFLPPLVFNAFLDITEKDPT